MGRRTILCAETSGAADIVVVVAERDDSLLNVVGVVAEILPRSTASMLCEYGVNRGDVRWCVQVGYVRAEVEEVVGA